MVEGRGVVAVLVIFVIVVLIVALFMSGGRCFRERKGVDVNTGPAK